MAKFLSFPKQRMAMATHQIAKIKIGEWPVKTLPLANPNAYGHSPKLKNPNRRMAKFKNWPFTSNLAIRLFWPSVLPDR